MENTAVIEATPRLDWRNIVMYDDEGRRITNPRTLRAMVQAEEIADAWARRIDSYHFEEISGSYGEEGAGLDTSEEKVS